jgi:hypothetical protein
VSYGAPTRDAESWDTIVLEDSKGAKIKLPPRRTVGYARLKVNSEQKIDKKAVAGKKGAQRTKQGAEAATGTITYTFADWAWLEVEPGIDAIDPRGPSRGGPFLMSSPNQPPNFKYVLVESLTRGSDVISTKGIGTITITVAETTLAPVGTGKGTGKTAASIGSQYTRALTEAEILVLRAQREQLLILVYQDDLFAANAGSDAERDAIRARQQARLKEANDIQNTIATQGTQRGLDKPTETDTPTKAASAPPGKGVADGKATEADPSSYDPAKNQDAPDGAP